MALPDPALALSAASARALYSMDRCSPALGMEFVEAGNGCAKVRMKVRPDMLNGLGTCHGGMIFSLADSAFAFACNSHNVFTVGQSCSIDYLLPANEGDLLTAEASEQAVSGRVGIYYVRVLNQRDELIACFRGLARQRAGKLVPDGAES
jgi:acyl-CoA thioesterase